MAKRQKQLDIIRLKNAVFYAYHGVLADEQSLGGKFEVDIDLYCDLQKGAISDRLEDTIDYERVYSYVRQLVEDKKHFLLESLAGSIAKSILKNFRKVEKVTVRIRKPGVPIKGIIDYVEVEMTEERTKRV
ncbi:MAG: dihydroneopterin aldolase [Bacteroidetes bacterium]|nr:dihydroneopterin aldolase [Bacteroidota bacterium]